VESGAPRRDAFFGNGSVAFQASTADEVFVKYYPKAVMHFAPFA
jgi:hypothetical protein